MLADQGNRMVIFVEDNEDLRAANIQSLQLAELRVQAFNSGAPALKIINPDFAGVVVSDIRMPVMDGHRLFTLVQAQALPLEKLCKR